MGVGSIALAPAAATTVIAASCTGLAAGVVVYVSEKAIDKFTTK